MAKGGTWKASGEGSKVAYSPRSKECLRAHFNGLRHITVAARHVFDGCLLVGIGREVSKLCFLASDRHFRRVADLETKACAVRILHGHKILVRIDHRECAGHGSLFSLERGS